MTLTPVTEPFPGRARFALPSATSTWFLAGGGIAIGIYFLLSPDAQDIWYVLIGSSSIVAVLIGTRRIERGRSAWLLFAAGLLANVIGDTITGSYELFQNTEPFPSVADVFYLASYPLLIAGVFLLLRELGGIRMRVATLDALIVTIAAGTVQWIFFVDPYLHSSLKPVTRMIDIAYPTMDLLMFVALVQVLIASGGGFVSYQLLIISVALWVFADEIFGLSVDNFTAGGWLDSFWLASYVCWGAAALDPSARKVLDYEHRDVPRLTLSRLSLLAGALLTIPGVILVERYWPNHNLHPDSIAVGATLLAILVVVRFAGLVRAVEGARAAERVANDRLRQLDRLKDEFVSTVSHELRTPLTSISGYVELAREQADPVARGYLDIALRNAGRLLSLVNDLLFVARIQSAGIELDVADVDVAEVISESIAAAEPLATAGSVALRLHVPGGSTVVRGDRRRLGQVFDNLISNAIKFSPEGGDVGVKVDARGGVLRVEVADHGIGISPDDLGGLFQRFFRAQKALDMQIPGTGLGLYISKAIVVGHAGSITAHSEQGVGSSFTVEIPVSR